MDIEFNHYPTSNRTTGAFAEIDPSNANTATQNLRTLIVGQVLAGSPLAAAAGVPQICQGADWTAAQAGAGSQLARMVARYRARDVFGELWILPLADNPASEAASGSFTFTGPATSAGTVSAYIADQRVQARVASGATAAQIADAVAAACALVPSLSVTVASAAGVLTATAKNPGACGNGIVLSVNRRGAAGGEALPAGVGVTIAQMTGGSANPDIAPALAHLAEEAFEAYVIPYTDSASLDAIGAVLDDETGRWAWSQGLYGHAYSAYRGNLGAVRTFGATRNDQHISVIGFDGSATPADEWAASLAAACIASLRADPGLPLQTLELNVEAPPIDKRFGLSDRNALLYDGISTFKVGQGGKVRIDRVVTTYQKNAAGAPDDSFLDAETMAQLAYVCRDLKTYVETQFSRKKLVSDATRVTGSNIVSPSIIRASVIARYRQLERAGYVQNSGAFAAAVQVQAAGNGLVRILWPGDLVGQVRQVAILVSFTKST